jgi:hypothetical protein
VVLAFALVKPAFASDIRPSREFLSPELRTQQDDPSRHPGWLWVEQGETLWRLRRHQESHPVAAAMAMFLACVVLPRAIRP